MTDCRIKLVTNDIARQQWAARKDYAIVTGQELIERPWWYEDVETGRLFHDLYACIGWPSEVRESDLGLAGYAAIIGIIRPHNRVESYNPALAKFLLLDEVESMDVPTLIDACVEMRTRWGFGVRDGLLSAWYGDPDRFLITMARTNEWLTKAGGPENAMLVVPPEDFYSPKVFDQYTRALQSVLLRKGGDKKTVRFYFGGFTVLKNRLEAFTKDDPAIMAAGGLIHSLLCRTLWMDELGETVFNVEDS